MRPLLLSAFLVLSVGNFPLCGEEPQKASQAEDRLTGTAWSWDSGGELRFLTDGKASHTRWKRLGIWRKQPDGSLKITGGNGVQFKVRFANDGTGVVEADDKRVTIIRPLGKIADLPKP